MMSRRFRGRAILTGLSFAGGLAGLIILGSRKLAHFDAALVGYTFATLFATFGITYRYAMWLQRPPTRDVLASRLAGVRQPAPLHREPGPDRAAAGGRGRRQPLFIFRRGVARGSRISRSCRLPAADHSFLSGLAHFETGTGSSGIQKSPSACHLRFQRSRQVACVSSIWLNTVPTFANHVGVGGCEKWSFGRRLLTASMVPFSSGPHILTSIWCHESRHLELAIFSNRE